MKEQSVAVPIIWVLFGLAGIIVVLCLVIVGALYYRSKQVAQVLPTALPTAAISTTGQTEPSTATEEPTSEPTVESLSITMSAPEDGIVVDLGQAVLLEITASAPNGVRMVNVTSNGQGIGSFRGLMESTLDVHQEWTPAYAGSHTIVASLASRTGALISTEPIRIRVVDRETMARNAPIWANVESNVTEIRGLAKLELFEPVLLSRTELRQRLQDDFFYTEEEADRDVVVLHAFDFVPRDFDLYGLMRRYLGDSIGGFYDPATKEFVVVSNDNEVDALEQWIYAHEYMHALQDQHFQLGLIADTNLGFEENLALRALAEGEAELLQNVYVELGYFTELELVEIFNILSRMRSKNVEYLPPVLVNWGLFPYVNGHEFASTIYQRQGWAGLNQVWQNPPQSTEHILHPDRYYAGDAPQLVTLSPLTDTLGSGWTLIEEAVMGEFLLREYLVQRLPYGEMDLAATGWGGDRYAVYYHEENDAFVMVFRAAWDTVVDQAQFVQGYATYADHSYGQQRLRQPDGGTCWQTINVICLYDRGSDTLVVRAVDLEQAVTVAATLR